MSIILKRKFTPGDGWQYVGEEEAGGGGGSLPDWWTVDSTPGSESFTLEHDGLDWNDTILINTPATNTLTGFYYVFRVRNVDTNMNAVVIDADGHFQLEGPLAQMQVKDGTGNQYIVKPYEEVSSLQLGTKWFVDRDGSMRMGPGVAFDDGNISTSIVRMFYDSTNGAAKIKFRGRTDDDTLVSGEIALT